MDIVITGPLTVQLITVAAAAVAAPLLVDRLDSMIGAAMLSVLLFPLIGLRLVRARTEAITAEPV